MTETERLKAHLERLNLKRMALTFELEAERAAALKASYSGYLGHLVEEELLAKTERSVNYRIKKAHFPYVKTIEGFNYGFQPTLNEVLIRELAELAFLGRTENVILIGPPGVGKTHLAIGLGLKACTAHKRVRFYSAMELLDELVAAQVTRRLIERLDDISRLDLLIIDELGYLPMDKPRANLCFQLVSRCYEETSLVVTSNKAFNQWGEVFGDEVIAGAILDRLLHHSHIIAVQGESFRMRDKRTKGVDKAPKLPENPQVENSSEGGQISVAQRGQFSMAHDSSPGFPRDEVRQQCRRKGSHEMHRILHAGRKSSLCRIVTESLPMDGVGPHRCPLPKNRWPNDWAERR